jgi:hypothetical protein
MVIFLLGANPAIRYNLFFFLKKKKKRIFTTIGARALGGSKYLVQNKNFTD